MTTPSWPSTTGFALADGFDDQFPVLAQRSEVDSGPARQRLLGTGAPSVVTLRYLMTSAEREWLRWFFASPAGGAAGAVWFDWTFPVTASEISARFLADKPPSYQPYKPDWIVTVTLEALVPLTEPA